MAHVNSLGELVPCTQGESQHHDCIVDDESAHDGDEDPAERGIECAKEPSKHEQVQTQQIDETLVDDVLLVDEPVLPLVFKTSIG